VPNIPVAGAGIGAGIATKLAKAGYRSVADGRGAAQWLCDHPRTPRLQGGPQRWGL